MCYEIHSVFQLSVISYQLSVISSTQKFFARKKLGQRNQLSKHLANVDKPSYLRNERNTLDGCFIKACYGIATSETLTHLGMNHLINWGMPFTKIDLKV
jgi:hypothetical protein